MNKVLPVYMDDAPGIELRMKTSLMHTNGLAVSKKDILTHLFFYSNFNAGTNRPHFLRIRQAISYLTGRKPDSRSIQSPCWLGFFTTNEFDDIYPMLIKYNPKQYSFKLFYTEDIKEYFVFYTLYILGGTKAEMRSPTNNTLEFEEWMKLQKKH